MAVNFGNLSTENVLQANRLFDVTNVIFKKFPDQAPFIALMLALGRTTVSDPEFRWFNRGDRVEKDTLDGAISAAALQITLDDSTMFLPGDLAVHVKTSDGSFNEIIRVTAVNTTTKVIDVVRSVGTTAAGTMADADTLIRIGPAYAEGSGLPANLSQQLVELKNQTQIFRHSSIYTRTFLKTTMRAGNQQKEIQTRREEKTEEHKRDIESNMWWGEFGIEGAGTETPNRKNGGLLYWLGQANTVFGVDNTQTQAGGTLTEAQLETFLEEKAFAFGSDEKWFFCAPRVISVINSLERSKIQLVNRTTSFGLNILDWESPHGLLHIVRHRQFKTGDFQFGGFVVDPMNVMLRHIEDSMSTFKTNVGVEEDDLFKDSWLTEVGLQVGVPESLAFLKNVQTAA